MTEDRPLTWREIYERLARRSDRPDARAWVVLGERVLGWMRDASLADETCAEVWRTFNAARGGASFEGFVQGRLVEVTRQINRDHHPTLPVAGGGSGGNPSLETELAACLEELRARNPSHHRVLALLYQERATAEEAADLLGLDVWTVRSLAARARMALARCLERAARQRGSGAGGDAEERPERHRRRSGRRDGRSATPAGRQPRGRPPRRDRPR